MRPGRLCVLLERGWAVLFEKTLHLLRSFHLAHAQYSSGRLVVLFEPTPGHHLSSLRYLLPCSRYSLLTGGCPQNAGIILCRNQKHPDKIKFESVLCTSL